MPPCHGGGRGFEPLLNRHFQIVFIVLGTYSIGVLRFNILKLFHLKSTVRRVYAIMLTRVCDSINMRMWLQQLVENRIKKYKIV